MSESAIVMRNDSKDFVVPIVRLGIGHSVDSALDMIDWQTVKEFTKEQGLYAIAMDGIEKCYEIRHCDIGGLPQMLRLEWAGAVIRDYEHRFYTYEKAISSLAGFYNAHGFKMMVLKGYACALDWPKPFHRPCGDIDIWLFGRQKVADVTLAKEIGIQVDKSQHHHSVFEWEGFSVENHYDFVNVYAHKGSRAQERILKELGRDDSHYCVVNGERVYLPSPNLHAFFLIRHMAGHFAAVGITMRHILDWAFFVEKHRAEVDWESMGDYLERSHLGEFFDCINAVCVEDLGFPADLFPKPRWGTYLKRRVFDDILMPVSASATPKGLLRRMWFKYRRWRGNAWKQRMCFGESRLGAFLRGVWAKLLKPGWIFAD